MKTKYTSIKNNNEKFNVLTAMIQSNFRTTCSIFQELNPDHTSAILNETMANFNKIILK
jgi:hypothetical protein